MDRCCCENEHLYCVCLCGPDGLWFLLAASIPVYCTGPALILTGSLMMINITKIDWNDVNKAVPAFITISIMVCAAACCIILLQTTFFNTLDHQRITTAFAGVLDVTTFWSWWCVLTLAVCVAQPLTYSIAYGEAVLPS